MIGQQATKQAVLQRINSVSLINTSLHMVMRRKERLFLCLLELVGDFHVKPTAYWQWVTFCKFSCEPNLSYLAVVTVVEDRLKSKELLEWLERSWDPVLAQ